MRKAIVYFVGLCMTVCLLCSTVFAADVWDGSTATVFQKGSGTKEDPYLISTGAELAYLTGGKFINLSKYANTYYALANDIILHPDSAFTKDENGVINGVADTAVMKNWKSVSVTGHIDGRGHTVYGLYCDGTSGSSLIGDLRPNSTLKNLTLGYGYVSGQDAAGLVERADDGSSITNCANYATVIGNSTAGGIAQTNTGTISDCTNYGKVSSVVGVDRGESGGIVCQNYTDGVILNCANYGDIYGYSTGAGIAASNYALIARCTNEGYIYGIRGYAGGIVGGNSTGSMITSCVNHGKVEGGVGSDGYYGSYPGGIASLIFGSTVENCLNTGTIKTPLKDNGGGLVGYMQNGGAIYNSVSVGAYEGTVEEICGEKESACKIENCYYASDVTGEASFGTGKNLSEINSSDFAAVLNTYVEASQSPYIQYWLVKDGVLGFAGPEDVLTISASAGEGGTVSPEGDIEVLSHYDATFTLIPSYGYIISDILVDGVSVGASSEYVFRDVTANHTIQAIFAENGLVAKGYDGGTGTEADPYQIANATHLRLLTKEVLGGEEYLFKHFVMTGDIVLNEADCFLYDEDGFVTGPNPDKLPEEWLPIGESNGTRFYGTFDGQGHSISGLYIDKEASEGSYTGLFGYADGALSNIALTYGYVSAAGDTGGIAGSADEISGCVNRNTTVVGTSYVGGLGGWPSKITDCTNYAPVSGTDWVGGITGAGKVRGCTNYGAVSASHYSGGGIAGGNCASMIECINYGSVTGGTESGGLIGDAPQELVSCYNFGAVSGTKVGGLVGEAGGEFCVTNCISFGPVNGGFADFGYVYSGDPITLQNVYYVSDRVGATANGKTQAIEFDDLNSLALVSAFNQQVQALDGNYRYWELDGVLGYPVLSEKENLYQVVLKTLGGGTIEPAPVLALVEGSSVQVQLRPDVGNSLLGVTINGSAAGAESVFVIDSLQTDYLVDVVFADAAGVPITGFAKGSGSKQTPFLVTSVEELNHMAKVTTLGLNDYEGYWFKLGNSITLDGSTEFTSIGTAQLPFNGIFDGDGHSVSALYIDSTEQYTGFFGHTGPSAVIKKLCLGDGSVTTTGNYAGAIVGYNAGLIENCKNNACLVEAQNGVGGIAGHNTGTIRACQNLANLNASAEVAGIVSWNQGLVSKCSNVGNITGGGKSSGICNYLHSAVIEQCVNRGTIIATDFYGDATGICSYNRGNDSVTDSEKRSSQITDCQNFGEIRGTGYAASGYGIIESGYDVRVTRCANYGAVFGNTGEAAGIAGTIFESYDTDAWCADCVNYGNVSTGGSAAGLVCSVYGDCCNSVNHGNIKSNSDAAGVAIMQTNDAYIYNCGNTGTVVGTSNVGGIIGKISSGVFNCYNTGTVSGTGNVGGLTGYFRNYNAKALYNCYTSGEVSGTNAATTGALVGKTETGCPIVNCWYNSDLCDLEMVGTSNSVLTNCGGKTSIELSSDEFLSVLNQGSYEGVPFKRWFVDSRLNLPIHGEFKATPLDSPAYVTVTTETKEEEKVCLTIFVTGTGIDSCYFAAYDENGQMRMIRSVTCDAQPQTVSLDAKYTWKLLVLDDTVPMIPYLGSNSG